METVLNEVANAGPVSSILSRNLPQGHELVVYSRRVLRLPLAAVVDRQGLQKVDVQSLPSSRATSKS